MRRVDKGESSMRDYTYDRDDWRESYGDFTNITEVFTTVEAWPEVRKEFEQIGIPESQLAAFDDLTPVLRVLPAGVNHLFGFTSPWLEKDDLVGTPKVWSTGPPREAHVAFPSRSPDGPGTGITVGVVDTGYRRHRWVRGACTYSA